MTDFYTIADGRSTAFYLGEAGTCGAVDAAINDWHERILRERQEAFVLRQRPESVDE